MGWVRYYSIEIICAYSCAKNLPRVSKKILVRIKKNSGPYQKKLWYVSKKILVRIKKIKALISIIYGQIKNQGAGFGQIC